MTTKNERSARTITAIGPITLGKAATRAARERIEKQNEGMRAALDTQALTILDGVLSELARAEAEYNWEMWTGAIFSHAKWTEEWADTFGRVAALADLEPGEKLIVEPVDHDRLVEAAKSAIEKVAAEYRAKVLPFCHAMTSAPRSETSKSVEPNGAPIEAAS